MVRGRWIQKCVFYPVAHRRTENVYSTELDGSFTAVKNVKISPKDIAVTGMTTNLVVFRLKKGSGSEGPLVGGPPSCLSLVNSPVENGSGGRGNR